MYRHSTRQRKRTLSGSLSSTPLGVGTGASSSQLENRLREWRWPPLSCTHAPTSCIRSKKLAPVYEKVAEHFHRLDSSRVRVGKIDATAHPGLAAPFDIKGYPTLVLLRDGVRIADHKGPRTQEGIIAFVEESLSRPPGAPVSAPSPTRPKKQARSATRLLARAKSTLLGFSDVDPLHAGFIMLGAFASFALCVVVALLACTKPSTR